MKSLVPIFLEVLADASAKCDAPSFRDTVRITERAKHEGDSFFTIALPQFCKDFEASLDRGFVAPSSFPGFGKRGGIPNFLGSFLRNVFSADGRLLSNPRVDCISAIRQICLFAKKIERPCSDARLLSATRGYRETEEDVRRNLSANLPVEFGQVADIIVSSLSKSFDTMYEDFRPRHGPGAVVEGFSTNKKWTFPYWTERLEEYFPLTEFAIHPTMDVITTLQAMTVLSPGNETPVKVIFVPKTMKTPRVIGIEPAHMQYVQQGISRWLSHALSACRYTSGHVNLRDQSINQRLASKGSIDGTYATLDLSEASDRVSNRVVERLFRINPELLGMIQSCRSTHATLPDGSTIRLAKFASMGSALCFPIESLVFFVTLVSAGLRERSLPLSPKNIFDVSRGIFVFGDDLIVPRTSASFACQALESIGLKVNRSKSFWTGKFRESCGGDFYDGVDVKPTYLRRDLPDSKADVHGVVSAVATANQLFDKGFIRTANYLRKIVDTLYPGIVSYYPWVKASDRTSACLGFAWNNSTKQPKGRWNHELHRYEIRGFVPTSKKVADQLDGYPALLKCFSIIGNDNIEVDHLSTSVKRYSLALKCKWVPWSRDQG